jgi:ferredoxin-NADP reductase
MTIKIGGNFIWPPMTLNKEECISTDNVVFVAGGVGINPIMSMFSAMDALGFSADEPSGTVVQSAAKLGGMRKRIRMLYASKREHADAKILFEDRLCDIARRWDGVDGVDFKLAFFETSPSEQQAGATQSVNPAVARKRGRIAHRDLLEALGPEDKRRNTVAYICGPPEMTDEFVDLLGKANGMDTKRVLCEKWW